MESNNKKNFTVFWAGTPSFNVEQEKKLNGEDTIKQIFYFDDKKIDECLKCLRLTSDENILLVIIGTASNKIVLDEKLLTEVHNLRQVNSIYMDEKYCNHHPSQLFPKVKYVSNQTVCLRIQADLHAYAQITEPFVFNTFDEHSLLTMNGDFMYFQMLIDSFVGDCLDSKFFDDYSTFAKSKDEFIETCKEEYKNNPSILAKIEEFKRTYTPKQALYWYTQGSFPFSLLNRALRTYDTRLILSFRFFIIDVYNQLVEESHKPFTEENPSYKYCVYRGQLMPKHELNTLRKSLGNIISIQSFFSTSLDRQVASWFLAENDDSSQSSLIRALIEIDLGNDNYCNSGKPFANITRHSQFGEVEKEVLFMVGSCFRVSEVRRDEKGIWYVHLEILSPLDNPLRTKWGALYHHMQTNFIHEILIRPHIGTILFQLGKFDQAQTYYTRLIQHLEKLIYVPEEIEDEDEDEYEVSSCTENKSGGLLSFLRDVASNVDERSDFEFERTEYILLCNYALGRIANEQGLFDHSIIYYETVLNKIQPSFIKHEQPRNSRMHVLSALCHLGLGATYELNGKLNRALDSYTKALQMFEQAHDGVIDKLSQSPGLTYVQKAHCLIGLGNLRLIAKKYEQADAYYRDALSLFDKYLPAGHPDQSCTRQKIANIVQIYQCKPAIALEDYEDCLQNYLRSLPSDHVDIGRVYMNMACAYEQLPNELEKALEHAKKAADIFKKGLSKEHPDNVTICTIIKRIQSKLCIET